MIFDVQVSAQADSDLRDIYEYIAFDCLAPENALGQLDRLEDAISKLSKLPERFRIYDREPWRSRGLRVFPADHYLVFYIPDKVSKTVHVLRVIYGGRDIDEELKRRTDESDR